MQLTRNFRLSEFQCNCGRCTLNDTKINQDFVDKLQELRFRLGKPMQITSGFRCKDWNTKVGGSKKSQHLVANAADIVCDIREDRVKLIRWALELGLTVGLGKGFLHFDNREYQTVFDY